MFFFALTLGLGESLHGPGDAFPRGTRAVLSVSAFGESELLGPSPPDWLFPIPVVLPVLLGLLSAAVISVLRNFVALPVTRVATFELDRCRPRR